MSAAPPLEQFDLQRTFNLPTGPARLLLAFMVRERLNARVIEDELKIASDAKIAIYRLRRRIAAHNIKIECIRDAGYWLTPEAKALVMRLVTGVVSDAA